MQQHRQVALGRQVVDTRHGFVVGARRVTAGQSSQVIVAGEHLANALPQPRMQIEHALDMAGGVLVHRIEAGQERMKALALLVGQLL